MGNSFANWLAVFIILAIISLLAAPSVTAQAQEKRGEPAQKNEPKKDTAAKSDDKQKDHAQPSRPSDPRFERMKRLVGKWKGTASHGDAKFETTVSYKLVGAGSALVETLFEGEQHEMITVYHMDGSDLVMTHYCAAGNQPHCRAIKSDDPKSLRFDFVSGCNIKPEVDMHMHAMTLTWESEDKINEAWTSWEGGKPSGSATFELERAK